MRYATSSYRERKKCWGSQVSIGFFFHKKKEEEVIHFPSQSPIRIEALRKKKIFDFFLSDLSSIKRGINNNSSSRAAMECVCPLCWLCTINPSASTSWHVRHLSIFCAQADTPRPRCAFKKYFTEEVLIGTSDGLTLMDDGADQPHSLEEIAVRNNWLFFSLRFLYVTLLLHITAKWNDGQYGGGGSSEEMFRRRKRATCDWPRWTVGGGTRSGGERQVSAARRNTQNAFNLGGYALASWRIRL